MQKVTTIPVCLTDTPEKTVSLSAQVSVGTTVTNEGYRRVRCSAAMIGLAISMTATSILLPNQSKPAMATGSSGTEIALANIATLAKEESGMIVVPQTELSSAPKKLTPPALKPQVKQGETLEKLSQEYQINSKAIAVSDTVPSEADPVAGQTLKNPSQKLAQSNSTEVKVNDVNRADSEALESSLNNLRQTRQRLQESLVALRSEDSTSKSKTKVIVTEITDTNLSTESGSNIEIDGLALSPDSSEEQAIDLPIEMPTTEFDSQTTVSPQIIDSSREILPNPSQPLSSTPINSSTSTKKENSVSSRNNNRRQLEPIPLATPEDSAFPGELEKDSEIIDISKLEEGNNTSSSPSSVSNSSSQQAGVGNEFPNESQAIELEVEPPKTATVVPPLQMPQPQVQQPASKKVYRVQRGENLNTIARKHGITVAQLIKANNITNPNLIKVNQPLVIPNLATAQTTQPRATVITGLPLNSNRSSSQLPPVPQPRGAYSSTSNLVSQLPGNSQSQGVSDIPSANGAIEISVEAAAESHTDKLRADVATLQQQYNNSQPIPIAVESPDASFSPVAQQPRNAEWDKDRRQRNLKTNTQSQPAEQPQSLGQQAIIGTASVNIEEYNNSLRIPVGETVSPELPGLSTPDRYLPDAPARFNGYIWPTKGVVTSGYGWRWGRMHKGVDIAAPIGTPIVAAAPGEVITAGWNSGGYGNLVKVRHADGSITLYAHNSRILVRRGQQVEQGQLIAEMGSTGYSTGPHLHFEVHPDGQKAVNPMAFLPKSRGS